MNRPATQWLFTHTPGSLINKTTTLHFTFIVHVLACIFVYVCALVRVSVCDLRCPLARGTFCAAVFTSRALSCPSTARKIPWNLSPPPPITLTSIPQKPQLPYPLLGQALKHTETNLFALYDLFYTWAFSFYIFFSIRVSFLPPIVYLSRYLLPKYPLCLDTRHAMRWANADWMGCDTGGTPPPPTHLPRSACRKMCLLM